jgi:hypothetical protein
LAAGQPGAFIVQRPNAPEIAMTADSKSPLEQVNDTLSQLK